MELPSHDYSLQRRRWVGVAQRCIVLGSLGIGLMQVVTVALKRDFYQYDFRSVYLAEQLLASDKNPYAWEELLALSQSLGFAENNHPFLYPPHALVFYAPLSLMSPALAYYAWLSLNAACFLGLFFMMVRRLGLQPLLAAPILVLGMNSSLTACLRAGQLSLFTAACITLAGVALKHDKLFKSASAIWLGGIVKLQTLPLLGLLLLRRERRAAYLIALGVGFSSGAVLLGKLLTPTLWTSFEAAALHLAPAHTGPENGSTLNVVRNLLHLAGVSTDSISIPIAYAALAVSIAGVGLFTCNRLYRNSEEPLLSSFLFGVLTWELLLPRMMIYEWVVLLPALCFHLARISSPRLRTAIVLFTLLPGIYVRRYALGSDTFVPAQTVLDALLCFGNWCACLAVFVATVQQQARAAVVASTTVLPRASVEREVTAEPPAP